MPQYRARHDAFSGKTIGVMLDERFAIPIDPDNADWQRFLVWYEDPVNAASIDLSDQPPPE